VSRFATIKSEEARLESLADSASVSNIDENDPASVARFMKKMGREMGDELGDDFDEAIDEALDEPTSDEDVKVSDRLLALAKKEAQGTPRSATAQIEHWATLGRAVEAMMAYRDILALKKLGETLPIPVDVPHEDVHNLLVALMHDRDRETIKARIHAAGTPVYTTDPAYPGKIIEVRADGTRTSGRLEGRRFVADSPEGARDDEVAARGRRIGGVKQRRRTRP